MAMFIATLKLNKLMIDFTNNLKGLIKIEKKITVPILNIKLKCASFFESFEALVNP